MKRNIISALRTTISLLSKEKRLEKKIVKYEQYTLLMQHKFLEMHKIGEGYCKKGILLEKEIITCFLNERCKEGDIAGLQFALTFASAGYMGLRVKKEKVINFIEKNGTELFQEEPEHRILDLPAEYVVLEAFAGEPWQHPTKATLSAVSVRSNIECNLKKWFRIYPIKKFNKINTTFLHEPEHQLFDLYES